MQTNELYLSTNSIAFDFIKSYTYPHEILPHINDCILKLGKNLSDDYQKLPGNIWIHNTAKVDSSSTIIGPCIICANAIIRPNAYIRGNAIIGKNALIGNCCEIKNSILFDECRVPHFNYVGDSILGYKSHLGAGCITSNIKNDQTPVIIKGPKELSTNLIKVGAFLGDNVEVGCNSVLSPGTIIGPNTSIYPLSNVRGIIPPNSILKSNNVIITKNKKN